MGDRRAPLLVGIGTAVVLVLVLLFLVLPKMGEVSDAQDAWTRPAASSRRWNHVELALQDAKDRAPEARATIAEGRAADPAAGRRTGAAAPAEQRRERLGSGCDLVLAVAGDLRRGDRALRDQRGSLSGSGTYFDVTEFMYRIETLPRAAKVSSISVAPGGGEGPTSTSVLSFTGTLSLYTSDTSTGPGSVPGTQTSATGEGA